MLDRIKNLQKILVFFLLSISLFGDVFEEFKGKFLSGNGEYYTINMATLHSYDAGVQFAIDHNITKNVFVFEVGYGKPFTKVMYGMFPTKKDAVQAVKSFSPELLLNKPTIEKVKIKQALYKKHHPQWALELERLKTLPPCASCGKGGFEVALEEPMKVSLTKEENTTQKVKEQPTILNSAVVLPQKTTESIEFKEALKLFGKKDYLQAFQLFTALFESEMDNPQVNFYIGRCATELKMYDEALAAFERVLVIDPTHTRSKIELARIYFEQKDYEQAADLFTEALKENIPEDVKIQINKFLEAIAKATSKHKLSGALIFGYNYDSNVKNDIGSDKTFKLGNLNIPGNEIKKDSSFNETLNITHLFKEKGSNYGWQNNFLVHNQHYKTEKESNIIYYQYASGITYNFNEYELSCTPSIDRLTYGGKYMMHSYGLGTKFLALLHNDLIFEQAISAKKQNFNEATKAMNASVYDATSTLKKVFDETILTVEYIASKNDAQYSQRTDVNQKSQSIKFDVSFALYGGNLGANTSWKQVNYLDENREDRLNSSGLSFSYPFNQGYLFSTTLNHLKNDSNLEQNRYKKDTYNVSFIKTF